MKEYFYTVTESMLDLGLRGTELNLFAVIYGYSQKGDGICYASRKELARRCGVNSPRTIDAALDHLVERGLVLVTEIERNGQTVPAYSYSGGCAKVAGEGVQNLHGGCAEIAPKKIQEENTISKNTIPPTPQEVADYCRSRGFKDPEGFADMFLEYCTNSGWRRGNGKGDPITNWKNYIVTAWEARNKFKTFPKREPAVKQIPKDKILDYLQ